MPTDTPELVPLSAEVVPLRIVKIFEGVLDFAAVRRAEAWCEERGISVGRMDRYDVRGLLLGNFDIAKWHNLSERERQACHGRMTGDMRNGPVTVTLTDPGAIAAVQAFDLAAGKAVSP
jgi:hypothetical protein